MAETCIVCLGDLVPHGDNTNATEPPIATDARHTDVETDSESHSKQGGKAACDDNSKEEEMIAHLLPCGHDLHNECLKPWVERANSCPICRASFNMVELSAAVGGLKVSEYSVQDKQQVAELDLSMVPEDNFDFEDDGSYDACMVCDEFGDSRQLMYCHSCERLCHVFCAGLDRMPSRGAWYCQACMENPALLEAAASRRAPARGPSAYINGRSQLPRRAGNPSEWGAVWQAVWDRLQPEFDLTCEDEEESESRSDVQRRENQEWERRFELARQMGAGTRFRAARDNIHQRRGSGARPRPTNRTLHREAPKAPKDPETQEEIRAWDNFEKARKQVAQEDGLVYGNGSNSRRRKRRSATSSPAESEPREQPARKLKRPRTRLNLVPTESSATAAGRNNSINSNIIPEQHASPPSAQKESGEASTGPGFLQSLLTEVKVDRFAEQEREIAAPQPKRIIVERACSPQNSSPGLSPVYQTPHGMTTPPPLNLTNSKSPVQDQQNSPTYSPYSPADDDRAGRHRLPHRPAGLSSPPTSKDSSPTRSSSLSYSTKAELQRMVTIVLKPYYGKKEISKQEYTDINRDISRLLYERVGGAGADALANSETREKWQTMASEEVATAVKALRDHGPVATSPAADDSASSSS